MQGSIFADDESARAGATFGPGGEASAYRYRLWRRWKSEGQRICWIMLNPSTATASTDDPTIRRCIAFSKAWGFAGLEICNLFALRSTDPAGLLQAGVDPVGWANDDAIALAADVCGTVVAAWGDAKGSAGRRLVAARAAAVCLDLSIATHRGDRLLCLGQNLSGQPKHPLYLAGATDLRRLELTGVS